MRIREKYIIEKTKIEEEIKRINKENDFNLVTLIALGNRIKELKELYKRAEMA